MDLFHSKWEISGMLFYKATHYTKKFMLNLGTLLINIFFIFAWHSKTNVKQHRLLLLKILIKHCSHFVLFVHFNLKCISETPHAVSASNQSIKAGLGPDWPPYIWTIVEILPIRPVCRAGTGKPHLSRFASFELEQLLLSVSQGLVLWLLCIFIPEVNSIINIQNNAFLNHYEVYEAKPEQWNKPRNW